MQQKPHHTSIIRQHRLVRILVATVFCLTPSLSLYPQAAYSYEMPVVDNTSQPPPDSRPAPEHSTKQTKVCSPGLIYPGSNFRRIPDLQMLNLEQAHRFADGRGIKVGVIDTGVTPNPRLAHLLPGGDYVHGDNGLEDCDGHGTIVAGIIAAQPSANDGFIGVAPEATIISIRQTSADYEVRDPSVHADNAREDKAVGTIATLAHAIVHAANLGAKVINMSVTSCVPANANYDLEMLKGAIYYAAVVKDVVLVSSAGNTENGCKKNPGYDPNNPTDPRNWGGVLSVSLPSAMYPYVLSVAAVDMSGRPVSWSMSGPWIGVAAPGEQIVSLNPRYTAKKPLVDAELGQEGGLQVIQGTSFSAAYVSGLAALVRQRFPQLSALQVITRIEETAHHPAGVIDNFVGAGFIDPLAALTNFINNTDTSFKGFKSKTIHVAPIPPQAQADTTARNIGLMGLLGALIIVVTVGIAIFLKGSKNPHQEYN